MIKTIVTVAFVAVLIALTTRYLRAVESEFVQQLLQGSEQAETVHVFSKFTLTNTNEHGEIESRLQSPNTRYIVTDQKTHLESPTMLVYRKQKAPVKISAESAIVDHRTNITTLHDNVDVSVDEGNNKPMRMTTEILNIDNADQVATTTAIAQIYYGSSRMEGKGLELDLNNKEVKFLDKVHGIYEQ